MRELDAVLDTSAIVCVLEDEPGADVVEERLTAAQAGKIQHINHKDNSTPATWLR